MLENILSEITIGSFSVIVVLTGYIWNAQGKKIDGIKKIQNSRPCGIIATDIASIKNDIIWIKRELNKKRWLN